MKLITVINPWQNSENVSFRYLVGSGDLVPDTLQAIPRFPDPLKRVVVLSTTQVAFLNAIGETGAITGMSGTQYVYHPGLNRRISSGLVKEIGSDRNLNYEMIIGLEPDAVFLFGVDAGTSRIINRLEDTGIPVIVCADYLESHPLGRAEWIRFFAAFFGKDKEADELFDVITQEYETLRQRAVLKKEKPTVFLGLPWNDTWYIAGGNSFAARFIVDAGGAYVWSDMETKEARPVDLEAVYARVSDADIWINPGIARSLQDITSADPRFSDISAVKSGRIFNNNLRIGPDGGNDYWESGVVHPHLVLEDLFRIFHNAWTENDTLHYYQQVK